MSVRTKVALAIAAPMAAFLLFDALLLTSVAGRGEDLAFAGMALLFRSLLIVPSLIVVNALLTRLTWRSKTALFIAALIPPAVVALYEYYSIYGRH
jgi:hypothetical protein